MVLRRAVALAGATVIGLTFAPATLSASAVSLTASPTVVRAAASAQQATAAKAAAKQAAAKAAKRTSLRVATFNVRSARVKGGGSWNSRAGRIARTIVSRKPGIVALQELGPGRADGKRGKIGGHIRQTESLVKALRSNGGKQYRLTRVTAYNPPHSVHGTQGPRILFDTTRYTLLSACREKTGKSNWNRSCSMELPRASGDGKGRQRSAAYALFKDKKTGKRFWVASAHLDERHGSKNAKYNALRQRQAAYVVNKVAAANPKKYPVIFGGDINSWRNDKGNWAPHRTLVSKGFVNTSSRAKTRINLRYSTVNHFKTVQKKSGRSTGTHLDVVMVKGAKSVSRWENVTKARMSPRPSDHNMVVADITL